MVRELFTLNVDRVTGLRLTKYCRENFLKSGAFVTKILDDKLDELEKHG